MTTTEQLPRLAENLGLVAGDEVHLVLTRPVAGLTSLTGTVGPLTGGGRIEFTCTDGTWAMVSAARVKAVLPA